MSDRQRALARLVLLVVLVVTAGGCVRVHVNTDGAVAPRVLSDAGLRSVLVEPSGIGPTYAVDTTRGPFYASCISRLFDLPDVGIPKRQASQQSSPVPDGWPLITQGVADHKSVAAADSVIDVFVAELEGCDHVRFRNGDELSEADVWTDDDRTSPAVDRQLNVRVIGTTKYDGDPERYPIGSWFSVMRVDNHILVSSYTDIDTEEYGYTARLDRALLERLLAVADGKKVPPMVPLDIEPTEFEDTPETA